jgi:hypothetical protein
LLSIVVRQQDGGPAAPPSVGQDAHSGFFDDVAHPIRLLAVGGDHLECVGDQTVAYACVTWLAAVAAGGFQQRERARGKCMPQLPAVLAFFLACVELFAHPGIASALLLGPDLLAVLLFTPLLAAWSIWVGTAISARSSDVRVAGQLSLLASLPSVAVTTLIALNVIPATRGLALGGAAVLLVLDMVGWRMTSAAFDRERLITSTR